MVAINEVWLMLWFVVLNLYQYFSFVDLTYMAYFAQYMRLKPRSSAPIQFLFVPMKASGVLETRT